MADEVDKNDLKAAGAELLTGGLRGLRIHGWEIVSKTGSILTSSAVEQWEDKLQTSHLPEMVFGDNCLVLKHMKSGTKIHFNAFDALTGWKQEALPPVEVPAAAQWKFRSKPFQQVILDYDYTFTTPYIGSETIENQCESGEPIDGNGKLQWEDCKEQIDVVSLASKEPILFYDELRVDGVLMRLRDTRIHCGFSDSCEPVILRESCWRQATFEALSAKGYPIDDSAYSDPNIISQRLPVVMRRTQKLKGP
ncbi:TIP41-like protein [Linum perenne]